MTISEKAQAALERLGKRGLGPGERLCALREASNLSERSLGQALARYAGDSVSGPTVHEWEHGSRRPGDANRRGIERWSKVALKALDLAQDPIRVADWDAPAQSTEAA